MINEAFRGDPEADFNVPADKLDLDDGQLKIIEEIVSAPVEESLDRKDAKSLFVKFVLSAAGKEADSGVSRASNKRRVTDYLNLFGLDFADRGGHPYAFCAAGIGWAACKGYCEMDPKIGFADPATPVFRRVVSIIKQNYFLPHPSCLNMVQNAKSRKNWIAKTAVPLPGWLVLYNWSGGALAEHVGIVETASAHQLRTIEFNTSVITGGNQRNGGVVARKNRDAARGFVLGYIATYVSGTGTV